MKRIGSKLGVPKKLLFKINSSAFVGMEGLYFDTQESELELVGCMRPTKTPSKDKNPRCIVDYVHLNSMVASYNRHFMLYSRDKTNVT